MRALTPAEIAALPAPVAAPIEAEEDEDEQVDEMVEEGEAAVASAEPQMERGESDDGQGRRRRRRRRGRRGEEEREPASAPVARQAVAAPVEAPPGEIAPAIIEARPAEEGRPADTGGDAQNGGRKRRRRGRRGGRRRRRGGEQAPDATGSQPDYETKAPPDSVPIAETVEYVPPEPMREDSAGPMTEALRAPTSPDIDDLAAESVPVSEYGDHPIERAPATEPPAAASETPPDRATVSPPAQPVANPKRGWWRRSS